jgi:hypothetical protein
MPDIGPSGPRTPYPVDDPGITDPKGPGSEPDYLPGAPKDPARGSSAFDPGEEQRAERRLDLHPISLRLSEDDALLVIPGDLQAREGNPHPECTGVSPSRRYAPPGMTREALNLDDGVVLAVGFSMWRATL